MTSIDVEPRFSSSSSAKNSFAESTFAFPQQSCEASLTVTAVVVAANTADITVCEDNLEP